MEMLMLQLSYTVTMLIPQMHKFIILPLSLNFRTILLISLTSIKSLMKIVYMTCLEEQLTLTYDGRYVQDFASSAKTNWRRLKLVVKRRSCCKKMLFSVDCDWLRRRNSASCRSSSDVLRNRCGVEWHSQRPAIREHNNLTDRSRVKGHSHWQGQSHWDYSVHWLAAADRQVCVDQNLSGLKDRSAEVQH
jgi:hypothetical protein